MAPGLSATCMFCLIVHCRGSFALWQSLSEVQGKSCPICLPIGPHGASPHTHTMPRVIFFVFLKFSGTTTQNLTLTARTANILCLEGSFGTIFHWRNLPGKICPRIFWVKFAGEICGGICRRKFAGKICGGICRRNFWRKMFKAKSDFRQKPPKNISLANSTVLKMCHRHIPRTLPSLRSARGSSSGQGALCVHALPPRKRHEEGYQGWGFSVFFADTLALWDCHCALWMASTTRTQRLHMSEGTFGGCKGCKGL